MKIKKNSISFAIIIVLSVIVYILLSVKPIKNNIQLEPVWTIDVTKAPHDTRESNLFPFVLGGNVGYFTASGNVTTIKPIEESQRVAISKEFYASYPNNAESISFYFPKGNTATVIERAGFPFFEEDRIFLLHPNGTSFSSHNKDGSEKWSFEYYCPITSINSSMNNVVVGYADGKIMVLDNNGRNTHEIKPAGSEHEVIFGVGVSDSSKYVACISGVNKQRIVISDITGTTSKIIYHEYIDSEVFEQSLVQFSENEKYAFFNERDSLIAIDLEVKKSITIPVLGKIMQIKEINNGEYYFVLSKNDGKATVTILNNNIYTVGSFSFNNEKAFIDTDLHSLYVGNGNEVSKINVVNP